MNFKNKILLCKLIALFLGFVFSAKDGLSQFTKLYDFTGTNSGSNPVGTLIIDGNYLYGMTTNGNNIFKIRSDGTDFTNLHNFSFSDGSSPNASLYFDGAYMYGTNQYSGASWGTIFKIKPDGTAFEKLYNCGGTSNGNGAYPLSSLLSDGTHLYGTTSGTSGNYGAVFKIKPDGTDYSQFNFNNTNGSKPREGLISEGLYLYGMTQYGGINNAGVIYKIKPDGTDFSKVFDFSNANGTNPYGKLISDGTYLYGMTSNMGTGGYGVVFRIRLDGTNYTILHNFNTSNTLNGLEPRGSLMSDGTYLYGMTRLGGANGKGMVFKIKPDGSEFTRIVDFDGINGEAPNSSLVSDGQYLYGMTYLGGTNNKGVIFKLDKNSVVGMNEINIESNRLNLFPNPTNGSLYVDIKVAPGNSILSHQGCIIVNVLNQTVLNTFVDISKPFTLDLNNLNTGVYFIKVGNCVSKFVKE